MEKPFAKSLRHPDISLGLSVPSSVERLSEIPQNIFERRKHIHDRVKNIAPTSENVAETAHVKYLEACFEWESIPMLEGLEIYKSAYVRVAPGVIASFDVIGASHIFHLYNEMTGEIIATEMVACLPLEGVTPLYKLDTRNAVRPQNQLETKKGYSHKIFVHNARYIARKFGIPESEYEFLKTQNAILGAWNADCAHVFNYEINNQPTGANTAGKIQVVDGKIVLWSMHAYQGKVEGFDLDCPDQDKLVFTRSTFDLEKVRSQINA